MEQYHTSTEKTTNIDVEPYHTTSSEYPREYKRYREIYGQDAKFHFLVEPDGKLGELLPEIIELDNPVPNEPPLMKKRKSPRAKRFYKAKNDFNATRFFLHELMLYCHFDQQTY